VRVKKLVLLILVIIILLWAVFSYFYFFRQDPVDFLKQIRKQTIDFKKSPEFIYAINNEPGRELDYPASVLVVRNTIYISDVRSSSVHVYDYNGKYKTSLVPGSAKFRAPYGLTSDGSHLYVADVTLRKIFVFDLDGKYQNEFKVNQELAGPGVILFKDNKLFVADQPKHKILLFDLAGNLLSSFGEEGHGKGQLYFPHGLAVDDKGVLYVSDGGNNRIVVFGPDGSHLRDIGVDLLSPRGLSMDNEGNLWVAAGLVSKIHIYKPDGTKMAEFGKFGAGYGQVSLPNGVFVDQNQRVYITEFGNGRVSVFRN